VCIDDLNDFTIKQVIICVEIQNSINFAEARFKYNFVRCIIR